jgi:acid stress chaperone HdeB
MVLQRIRDTFMDHFSLIPGTSYRARAGSNPSIWSSVVKILSVVLVAAALVAAPQTQAEPIDLSKLKCKEFIESGPDKMTLIVTWLTGFNTEEDDDLIFDFDVIKAYVDKVGAFCKQNPDFTIKAAADGIMQ